MENAEERDCGETAKAFCLDLAPPGEGGPLFPMTVNSVTLFCEQVTARDGEEGR